MKAILKIRVFTLAGFLTVLAPFSVIYSQYFRGYLQSLQGNADCNPCVQNVIHSVNTLRDRGETMGFNWGANYPPVEGSGTKSHWQGIQRMPILPNDGLSLPYIAVSSSHGDQSNPFSRFAIVEMASRDKDGLRLRSNRLEQGRLTKDVAPNALDRIIMTKVIRTDYDHAGGMQAIGKYLLTCSETATVPDRGKSLFSLFDMSKPEAPVVWEFGIQPDNGANSAGIVRLEGGRYLMLRTLSDALNLEFYITRGNNIRENNWVLWDRWVYTELKSELRKPDGSLDLDWRLICFFKDTGYQNINIVADCNDGRLYLIASHGRCPDGTGGDDFVDAYRLDVPTSSGDVIITKVAKRHMFPGNNSDERQGDLQAAGGVYVSPDNKLYFYATEHGRNGPGNSVKMIEFGPEEPRSQVSKIEDAWVELYADKNFEGRSIILDYVDRDLRDYNKFLNVENFNDIASSLIYAIPTGQRLRLYAAQDQNSGEGFLDLNGTGKAERIADLHNVMLSNGQPAGDKLSSARWNAGFSAEVWVAFSYGGLIQIGTFQFPFNTLSRGLAGVLPGGVIKIKSSSSSETSIITKPVTLEAYNGTVVIGKK